MSASCQVVCSIRGVSRIPSSAPTRNDWERKRINVYDSFDKMRRFILNNDFATLAADPDNISVASRQNRLYTLAARLDDVNKST